VDVAVLITETGFSGLYVKCIATVPCQIAKQIRLTEYCLLSTAGPNLGRGQSLGERSLGAAKGKHKKISYDAS